MSFWDDLNRNRGIGSGPAIAGENALGGSAWSEAGLMNAAGNVEAEEGRRYEEGIGYAKDAFATAQTELMKGPDQDLLFSRAADSIGARGRRSLESVFGSLSGRGLSPTSGAGRSMVGRLAGEQTGALIGADRDIAIDTRAKRQANAAQNFINALNLSGQIQGDVSTARMDMGLNLFEGNLVREGMENQRQMVEYSNKKDFWDYATDIANIVPWK